MRRGVLSLLVMIAGAAPSGATEVAQSTAGWCSPIQSGNNNVFVCNGVDPRAMERLNELLDRKDDDLKQKTAEANDWARRYNELNAQLEETKNQLAAKGEDATLVQTAQDLLHEGKLEEARAIFDRLIQSDEANVDRVAEDHFARAVMFSLQFRLDEALPDLAKAYQYRRENQRYAEGYGEALVWLGDYPKAESVLQDLLRQLRSLATQNPADFDPDLAKTPNNRGLLYRDTGRYADAETAHKEALDIERGLAAQNPAAFQHDLAAALSNLGLLYTDAGRFADAEAVYKEAVDIWQALAAHDPASYWPDLSGTVDNLGNLYVKMHRFAEAEATYKESAAPRADGSESGLSARSGVDAHELGQSIR
jgi:hypothetical protein